MDYIVKSPVKIHADPSVCASIAIVVVSNEQLMAEAIYRKAESRGWFPDEFFGIVAVRSAVGHYDTFPHASEIDGSEEFLEGLRSINCAAGVMTSTHVVQRIIRTLCVSPLLSASSRKGPALTEVSFSLL